MYGLHQGPQVRVHVVVVIQKVNESFSLGRNQAEPVFLLGVAEVPAVGVEDLSNLGVLALEDKTALVDLARVVVDDDPLLDEAEAQALQHLGQKMRTTTSGYLNDNQSREVCMNVCMYVGIFVVSMNYVCMYVCMYVYVETMYVFTLMEYVCMYVCTDSGR